MLTRVTVREVLYRRHDKISAEWPFGSGATAKVKSPLS